MSGRLLGVGVHLQILGRAPRLLLNRWHRSQTLLLYLSHNAS